MLFFFYIFVAVICIGCIAIRSIFLLNYPLICHIEFALPSTFLKQSYSYVPFISLVIQLLVRLARTHALSAKRTSQTLHGTPRCC